ncbi:CSLREA domain-containing protein, partial [Candidatus Saccharibacteria bacterium]|nr:CSLREA domain-containing protein [Candidatus Saccharibacteria bacterium]
MQIRESILVLNIKSLPLTVILPLSVLGFIAISISTNIIPVHAATTIVVNSTADDQDNDGECTLREAIVASNTDIASGAAVGECLAGSGSDTINFNIQETADFTNGGQDGYTISPTSALPDITETVSINGYSQPGAQANTAIAPNPLNGILLIELDGTNAGTPVDGIVINGASDVEVKGLVINSWSNEGININGNNATLAGCYIGTNPVGNTAQPNANIGVSGWGGIGNNATIGGLNPEDRNLISGNGTTPQGSGLGWGDNHDYWVMQGNFVGVAADGLTPIPNSQPNGSGNPSIDNNNGALVGGSTTGAINVIGESLGHGIAPSNADNVVIEGNYIGFGYDGITLLGNTNGGGAGYGISLSSAENTSIKNNIVSGWASGGIAVTNGSSDVTVTGNTVTNNQGISNINLGGFPGLVENTTIQGNKIGTKTDGTIDNSITQSTGITVLGNVVDNTIGGVNPGDGNIIGGNTAAGIIVSELTVIGFGSFTPNNNSIIGNTILNNSSGNFFGASTPGLGIDILSVTVDGTLALQSSSQVGPTLNDTSDPDTGSNNYLNFPVINSTSA